MTTITRPASPDARRRLDGAVPPPRGQALARNRGPIALGVLILAVSALLAVAVYSNIGDRQPVLVVARTKIGRAHVCTPVTNEHLVFRLLLEKHKTIDS